MDYKEYISSSGWKAKREERLQIDEYKCVVCKGNDGLQVHHLHYETLGNENARTDLVTACRKCHRYFDTIERFQRYQKRLRRVDAINQPVQERKDITYGMAGSAVQTNISLPTIDAQRADSRPNKQVVEINQTDFVQARQNR
jgi:hypothetical protein